jgi:hypothetical protein
MFFLVRKILSFIPIEFPFCHKPGYNYTVIIKQAALIVNGRFPNQVQTYSIWPRSAISIQQYYRVLWALISSSVDRINIEIAYRLPASSSSAPDESGIKK